MERRLTRQRSVRPQLKRDALDGWQTDMVSTPSTNKRLLARFSDRPDLGRDGVVAAYWGALDQERLGQFLDLIEVEFRLPAGLLRPDDAVGKLVDPFPVQNPITWYFAESARQDALSELYYQLGRQLAARGVTTPAPVPDTIGRFVELWCGPAV
jgi:hypothetical protein